MGAKHVDIFGTGINVGKSATFVATSDSNIRLTTWNLGEFDGKIYADDFCLFTPGVRIAAATEIKIGKGCMFANGSYVALMFPMLIGMEYTKEQNLSEILRKLSLKIMFG